MAQCSSKDIERLAHQARLGFSSTEQEVLQEKVNAVLAYVERIQKLIQEYPDSNNAGWSKMESRVREDCVVPTNTEPLLAQAPEQAGGCFVVPRIIEGSN